MTKKNHKKPVERPVERPPDLGIHIVETIKTEDRTAK